MKKVAAAIAFACILSAASVAGAAGDAPSAPAPATVTPPMPAWLQYNSVYTGEENNIANPHRTEDEITTWAQRAAADVLSFSKENHSDKVEGFKKYFIKSGWDLYFAYLQDSKILEMVEQGGYSVSTIISAVPEMMNSGATGGSYHWILRMPITISFYKKDPVTGQAQPGPSGKFYLFMDILRVSQGGGDDGISISNWRVLDVPKN